jgi:carnitine O-acetyltransferase
VDNQELDVLSFQAFGSNYIKKSSYSPDGLVQTALQLASYRLMGKQVATYESSQVRLFLHGRTETTRSVSQANEAFVKAMGMYPKQNETNVDIRKEKLELLRNATEYHSKYLKHAARGYGVDRHFFGLSMLTGDNLKTPSLFSNPLFIRSKQWRLSTSTLPNTPGFGPVVEDGIGIGYEIKPDCCHFTITSRKKNDYVEAMRHLIEESLLEIQLLIDLDKQPPISKL